MRYSTLSGNRYRIFCSILLALFWWSSEAVAVSSSDWVGLVSASMGHDSNVTLADNSNIITNNASDNFINAIGGAGRYLSGNRNDGVRVDGVFYFRKYNTETGFDLGLIEIGSTYHKKLGEWYDSIGAKYSHIEFGGAPYQNIYTLTTEGRHKISQSTELRILYNYSAIDALSAQFNNTGGKQHQLNVEGRFKSGKNRYRLAWRLELNDLNDYQTATTFISSSAVRNRIRANAKIPFTDKWGTELDLRWRNSKYRDDNVTPTTRVRRNDDRLTAKADLNYELYKNARLYAEFKHTNNSSNISTYQYVRNEISLGMSYIFY